MIINLRREVINISPSSHSLRQLFHTFSLSSDLQNLISHLYLVNDLTFSLTEKMEGITTKHHIHSTTFTHFT